MFDETRNAGFGQLRPARTQPVRLSLGKSGLGEYNSGLNKSLSRQEFS